MVLPPTPFVDRPAIYQKVTVRPRSGRQAPLVHPEIWPAGGGRRYHAAIGGVQKENKLKKITQIVEKDHLENCKRILSNWV